MAVRMADRVSSRRWQASMLESANVDQMLDFRQRMHALTRQADCPHCGLPGGVADPEWQSQVREGAWLPECRHVWHDVAEGVLWQCRGLATPVRSAVVQGPYRYQLHHRWADVGPTVGWLMLNPSVANAERDDPTVRRVVGFSKAWGFAGAMIWNLDAFVATDPDDLQRARSDGVDVFGPRNADYIRTAAAAPLLVCAWGRRARADNVDAVNRELVACNANRWVFGWTAQGHQPRHPLRLHGETPLKPWGLGPDVVGPRVEVRG
jgi:hypothetical protein